ncbi:hypothetical protein ACFPFX_27655 [Streptomyces mauvecolor]|uniref:Uncharacterized protein n=1 Tax=Streptomyces mauvecolor TaxID=58345 RepID=A0ABV9UWP1_9ACTN
MTKNGDAFPGAGGFRSTRRPKCEHLTGPPLNGTARRCAGEGEGPGGPGQRATPLGDTGGTLADRLAHLAAYDPGETSPYAKEIQLRTPASADGQPTVLRPEFEATSRHQGADTSQ